MPRRAKRIRHDEGFSKGHEDTVTAFEGLQVAEEGPSPASAHPRADTHLLNHLNHHTSQAVRLKAVQRLARHGNRATSQALVQRHGGHDHHDEGNAAPGTGGTGTAATGTAAPGTATATPTGTAAADPAQQQRDMETFLARGVLPGAAGQDVLGASGLGGFNAKWDPAERALIATVNVGFRFVDGMTLDASGRFVANAAAMNATQDARQIAQLQTLAATINLRKTRRQRAEMITQFQWGGDKATWMNDYRGQVVNAWSGQHYFTAKRFPDLRANVRLAVNVHENAQPGDHTQADIIKVPDNIDLGATVFRGRADRANDQRLRMGSSGLNGSPTNFLHYSMRFTSGKSDVASAVGTEHSTDPGPAYLNKFIADFAAGYADAGAPISVVGHSSAIGDPTKNQTLSEERATNVASYIRSNGLTGSNTRVTSHGEGQTGATRDRAWQRVDIVVGSGEKQKTAAHEFGHMIGLDDEYSSPAAGFYPGAGTPLAAGTATRHDTMAQNMGGGVRGAVAENSDNIMSVGNTVRPQHYATFHNALQTVTGEQWEYGGAVVRPVPLPATGGPNANGLPPGTAIA